MSAPSPALSWPSPAGAHEEPAILSLVRTKEFVRSLYGGWRHRHLFRDVKTFFLFIGYPSSGHTLLGSILDAHPHIAVSIELDVLEYVRAGFGKAQIFDLILERSRAMARQGHRWRKHSTDFVFDVPTQWQGRSRRLQALGDKKAGGTGDLLRREPWLLERLAPLVKVDVKFLHVIRNPFDNIARIHLKRKANRERGLEWAIGRYFSLCDVVMRVKKSTSASSVLDVRHEGLVAQPMPVLRGVCEFLGVEAPEDYLGDCAKIVSQSPHKSRSNVTWSESLIEAVHAGCQRYPYLAGYSYEK